MKRPALMTTDDIRAELSDFVDYARGEKLRAELKTRGASYKPRNHNLAYLSFLNRHATSFTENGRQEMNAPHVWTMFACVCQHVQGDSIEECLDKGILIAKRKRQL